jgi:hypothetical protein
MFSRTISQIKKIKEFESKPQIFKIFDISEVNKIINFLKVIHKKCCINQ